MPPPTWSHPDYIFNVDSMITKLKQIKDVSDASMQRHIEEAPNNSPVSSNKQCSIPCLANLMTPYPRVIKKMNPPSTMNNHPQSYRRNGLIHL